MALDGYREFKFGMTQLEIIRILEKQYPDSCQTVREDCLRIEYESEIESCLGCQTFPFGNTTIEAVFYFINNRFVRLRLPFPESLKFAVSKALFKKYGSSTRLENFTYSYGDGSIVLYSPPGGGKKELIYQLDNYKELAQKETQRIEQLKQHFKTDLALNNNGYKEFAFEIGKDELLRLFKTYRCVPVFEVVHLPRFEMEDVIGCATFPFGGESIFAGFYFIDNQFVKISLNIPTHMIFAVKRYLLNNYQMNHQEQNHIYFEKSKIDFCENCGGQDGILSFQTDGYFNLVRVKQKQLQETVKALEDFL